MQIVDGFRNVPSWARVAGRGTRVWRRVCASKLFHVFTTSVFASVSCAIALLCYYCAWQMRRSGALVFTTTTGCLSCSAAQGAQLGETSSVNLHALAVHLVDLP